jgi:hypothetical protein
LDFLVPEYLKERSPKMPEKSSSGKWMAISASTGRNLSMCGDDGPIEHLVQTQVVYLIASRVNCLLSLRFEANILFHAGTVVDFVTVKTSGFKSFQHPKIFCD